jgi:hypothetical protein
MFALSRSRVSAVRMKSRFLSKGVKPLSASLHRRGDALSGDAHPLDEFARTRLHRIPVRQPRIGRTRRSALDYALGAALVLMSVALIAIVLAIVIIG